MIRTDAEYREAKKRLAAERRRLAEHERRLRETPIEKSELKRALDPLRSFQLQLSEEIDEYERLKTGGAHRIVNLHGLGNALVATRISHGLTQRELADRLGVHESQVSRDERNEYRGLTVERASRILDALGVDLTILFDGISAPSGDRRRREARKSRKS